MEITFCSLINSSNPSWLQCTQFKNRLTEDNKQFRERIRLGLSKSSTNLLQGEQQSVNANDKSSHEIDPDSLSKLCLDLFNNFLSKNENNCTSFIDSLVDLIDKSFSSSTAANDKQNFLKSLIDQHFLPELSKSSSIEMDPDEVSRRVQLKIILSLSGRFQFIPESTEPDEDFCDEVCNHIQRFRLTCLANQVYFHSFMNECVIERYSPICPKSLILCYDLMDMNIPSGLSSHQQQERASPGFTLWPSLLSPVKSQDCERSSLGLDPLSNSDPFSNSNGTIAPLLVGPAVGDISIAATPTLGNLRKSLSVSSTPRIISSIQSKNTILWHPSRTKVSSHKRKAGQETETDQTVCNSERPPSKRSRRDSQHATTTSPNSKKRASCKSTARKSSSRSKRSSKVRTCHETPVKNGPILPVWEHSRQLARNKSKGAVVVMESPFKPLHHPASDQNLQNNNPFSNFEDNSLSNNNIPLSPTFRRSLRRVKSMSTWSTPFLMNQETTESSLCYNNNTITTKFGIPQEYESSECSMSNSQRHSNLFSNFKTPIKTIENNFNTPAPPLQMGFNNIACRFSPFKENLGSVFFSVQDPVLNLNKTPLNSILKSPLKNATPSNVRFDNNNDQENLPNLMSSDSLLTPVKNVMLSPNVRKRVFHDESSPMLFNEDAMFLDTKEFRLHSGSGKKERNPLLRKQDSPSVLCWKR